jgi:hypothetical protein
VRLFDAINQERHMFNRKTPWMMAMGMAAGAQALAGCAAPLPADGTAEANGTEAAGARLSTTAFDYSQEYTWDQGNIGDTTLAPADEGYCYLTGVSGQFEGSGEFVYVKISPGGSWVLGGESLQEGVSARARCFPWTRLPPGTHQVRESDFIRVFSDEYPYHPVAPPADTVCSLAGMGGSFNGGGERVAVNLYADAWYAEGHALAGSVLVKSQCLTTSPSPSWGFEVTWRQGDDPQEMGPIHATACMLTAVAGRFKGGGERVQILQYGGNWVLSGASQQQGVEASARCIRVL